MFIDLQWNQKNVDTKEDEETKELNKSIDNQMLSQKLNQSSASNIPNNKGSVMENIKAHIEKNPNYLTKQNKSFQEMIHRVESITITATLTNNRIEELRKKAVLIYEIMIIQTYHLLWTTYLKSGLGQLITASKEQLSYSTTVPIWPKAIKTLLQLTNKRNENETYLNFVIGHLNELDHQLKQYQNELNIRANNFLGYTFTIRNMIATFIEVHLSSFRLETVHQIELIDYDYHIRALKLEYFRHHPNGFQEQLMNEICQNKYEQKTTEQEYHLLKQQINYYNLPSQSFECSPIAQSTLIDSIQNLDVQQELYQQYREQGWDRFGFLRF